MNRSITKLFDEYQELTSQARNPSEYITLKHDQNEVPNLPVDSNLLYLTEKKMRKKYFEILYIDEKTKLISKEFSYGLLTYYLYISLIMLFNLILSICLYYSSDISSNFLMFQIILTSFFLLFGFTFLFVLNHSNKAILYNQPVFVVFNILIYLYLIVGSSQVFEGISSDSMSSHLIPTLAEIIGLTYAYRRLLFDSYRHLIFSIIPVLILFLILNLIYSSVSAYTTLTEFACFTLFGFLQIIEAHSVEHRTIQLFYRMEKEEFRSKNIRNRSSELNVKSENNLTELESLENKCEFVIKEIKHAISVIIFREVKLRLKNAQAEVVKIKNKLGSLNFPAEINLAAEDLDDEDKAFIAQNYFKNSLLTFSNGGRQKVNGNRTVNIKSQFNKSALLIIEDYLCKLGSEWNINPFYIEEKTGKTFSVISSYIFKIAHLEDLLKIPEDLFSSFFESLERQYKSNPYHNSIHAADVFSSLFYFYQNSELKQFSSKLDITCLLISSLGHDAGHPGLTNRFLIASRDKIAIQYNDLSVLENMHCSIIFCLLTSENHDILSEICEEDWINCRTLVISMILDTDLSKHFEICAKFKAKVSGGLNLALNNLDDKILAYSMALKCSDIGHSAKCKELHLKWTGLVMEEFFLQGDVEKKLGLQVSMYCDRNNTDVAKSQAGFIKNICLPLYENWCLYSNASQVLMCLKQLKDNFEYWDENYKNRKMTSIERLDN